MLDREIVCEQDGDRLDNYLKKKYPEYSREFLKKIIVSGKALVNGKIVRPSFRLSTKDKILIKSAEKFFYEKEGLPSLGDPVFEDKYFIAFNKPEGLIVHPRDSNWTRDRQALRYEETLVSILASRYGFDFCAGDEKMGLVHRLDKETSGVILVAKTKEFAAAARNLFAQRQVLKRYLGLACKIFEKDEFFVDAPIGRPCGEKKLRVYEYGRSSFTFFKVICRGGGFSYLEIKPKTGRTNQIRVHLSYLKAPILGDLIYGALPCPRLMLHSESLEFIHPFTYKKILIKVAPSSLFFKIVHEKTGKEVMAW